MASHLNPRQRDRVHSRARARIIARPTFPSLDATFGSRLRRGQRLMMISGAIEIKFRARGMKEGARGHGVTLVAAG